MRVFILGDSQAVGLGPRLAERLEADGHATHLLARVGKGARFWMGSGRATVDTRTAAFDADALVVVFGTNDWPNQAFRDAAATIAGPLLAGAPRVWVGSPRYKDLARQRRADRMLRIVDELLGDQLVDSRPHTDFTTVRRQPDGVHIRPSGLRVWADRVYPLVRKRLEAA